MNYGEWMTLEQLTGLVREGWEAWQAVLARVPGDARDEPVSGAWTVKDVVAHITWHEREAVGVIRARRLHGSPWWDLPTDERNRRVYEESRDRALADVLAEHNKAHADLMAALPTLDDDTLNIPERIEDMIPGYKLWVLIAQNTYEHYADHARDVMAWLAGA